MPPSPLRSCLREFVYLIRHTAHPVRNFAQCSPKVNQLFVGHRLQTLSQFSESNVVGFEANHWKTPLWIRGRGKRRDYNSTR